MKMFSNEYARKYPVTLIVMFTLIFMIGIFIPIKDILSLFKLADNEPLNLILGAGVRIGFSIFFFVALKKLKFLSFIKPSVIALTAIIPAFIIAVNNFPFIPLFMGQVVFISPLEIALTVLFCLSVGFFEEFAFRAIILPLFIIRFKDNKYCILVSILLSSALFGLVHLFNLFGGFNPMVFLQVGYSFLIGAMCAIVYLKSRNIIFAALIHALYNTMGQLCVGNFWSTSSIILTASVAVVVVIAMIFNLFTIKKDDLLKNYIIE